MSKSETRPQERSPTETDQTSLIGIDAEGSEHRWDHRNGSVRVQRPDETVDHYGAESVSAWCEIVEKQCGWTVCHAQMTLAELIARGFQ